MNLCRSTPCSVEDILEGRFDENFLCLEEALPGSWYCERHKGKRFQPLYVAVFLLGVIGVATWIAW